MKFRTNLMFVFILIFLFACTAGGSFISHNITNVELSDSEFNIIAKNVEGYSSASYLIGLTYSAGTVSNTLALVRIGGTAKLYNDAIQNLWNNFYAEHENAEGKKYVLANIRIDNDMLNLVLYTQTDLYITADIIEFEED